MALVSDSTPQAVEHATRHNADRASINSHTASLADHEDRIHELEEHTPARGPKGDTGADGPTGPRGPMGPAGPRGADGRDGFVPPSGAEEGLLLASDGTGGGVWVEAPSALPDGGTNGQLLASDGMDGAVWVNDPTQGVSKAADIAYVRPAGWVWGQDPSLKIMDGAFAQSYPVASTAVADVINFSGFFVAQRTHFDRIAYRRTATTGTQTTRLGLYWGTQNGHGVGQLVLDAGLVTSSAAGFYQITINATLDAGWYWIAATSTSATTPAQVPAWSTAYSNRVQTDAATPSVMGSAPIGAPVAHGSYNVSVPGMGTGSLPADVSGLAATSAIHYPVIYLRRAAS